MKWVNDIVLFQFTILMLVILILQIVIFALLLKHHKEISQELDKDFVKKWISKDDGFIHKMQKSLSCCGLTSKSEYESKIPNSCCPHHETKCDETNAYETNCKDAFRSLTGGFLDHNDWEFIKHVEIGRIIVVIVGILVESILFQCISVILSCCIMNFIYDSKFF